MTSDDVIEFYAKYGQDSPVAFFFCVRQDTPLRFRPYDLLVVRREDVRDEYYTVSATGVTHIRKGMPAGTAPLPSAAARTATGTGTWALVCTCAWQPHMGPAVHLWCCRL